MQDYVKIIHQELREYPGLSHIKNGRQEFIFMARIPSWLFYYKNDAVQAVTKARSEIHKEFARHA